METSSGGDSMFEKLNAGRRGGARQVLSSGAVVLAAHVVIGAVAVWATLRPQVATGAESPPVLLPWPAEPAHDRSPAVPNGVTDPLPPVLDLADRKSVVLGKSVDLGGRRIINIKQLHA